MSEQIDIHKFETILAQHKQQIGQLARALDRANARYTALSSFVLALPDAPAIDREKALNRLRGIRFQRLGSESPKYQALDTLESLLASAKAPAGPEASAA